MSPRSRFGIRHFMILFGSIWLAVGLTFLLVGAKDPDKIAARVIGGFVALAGGAIAGWGIRKVMLRNRLLRDGVRCEGTVVGVEETNVKFNNVTQWVVRFSFTDYAGQMHQAKTEYMSPDEASEWKPGDTGEVRYDQSRPAVNLWLGRGH